jgi:hypothetical protein
MVIAVVGNLAWPYRYWVVAGLGVMVWGLVVWFWWGRGRVQR